tara:strand:- start:160 stop:795 length:636 start_codon:yes stop_codon:yes gene_type:complete
MIIKPNMKKMLKKANIGSGNTINIGGGGDKPMAFRFGSGAFGSKDKAAREKLKPVAQALMGGGMAFRLKGPDRRISTAIKNAEKRRREKKRLSQSEQMPPANADSPKQMPTAPTRRMHSDQPLQKSGFNIAAIEARDAGKKSFEYAGKEFPVTQRMKEDGDGMYRMETMTPMNPMGAVPLRRDEMPMAYKQKVVKRTAGAKAIPFTNRNAL